MVATWQTVFKTFDWGAKGCKNYKPALPAHGPIHSSISLAGGNGALVCHPQGPLNGHNLVDHGNSEINLGNFTIFNEIVINKGLRWD